MRILLPFLSSALLLLTFQPEVVEGYKHACEVITRMQKTVVAMKNSLIDIENTQKAALKIVRKTGEAITKKKKMIEGQYQAIRNQRAGIERRSRRRRSGRNKNKKLCDD